MTVQIYILKPHKMFKGLPPKPRAVKPVQFYPREAPATPESTVKPEPAPVAVLKQGDLF